MRVVSWNVNGIRACVRHGFVGFVDRYVAADRNARNLLDEPSRQRSTRQLADLQVLTHQRESGGGDVLPKIAEGHQVAEVVGLRLTPLRLSQVPICSIVLILLVRVAARVHRWRPRPAGQHPLGRPQPHRVTAHDGDLDRPSGPRPLRSREVQRPLD